MLNLLTWVRTRSNPENEENERLYNAASNQYNRRRKDDADVEEEPLDASGTGNGAGISRADSAGRRAAVAAVRRAEWTKHRIGQWFVYGDERGLRDGACSRRYWNDFFALWAADAAFAHPDWRSGLHGVRDADDDAAGTQNRSARPDAPARIHEYKRIVGAGAPDALVHDGGAGHRGRRRGTACNSLRAAAGLGEGRVLQHLPRR